MNCPGSAIIVLVSPTFLFIKQVLYEFLFELCLLQVPDSRQATSKLHIHPKQTQGG